MSEANERNEMPKRPVEPGIGAVILFGSMAVAYAAAWLGWTLFPFPEGAFTRLPSPPTSQGAWLILSGWLLFPVLYGAALLRMTIGVAPERMAWAFGGVTYFLQCAAEFSARDEITLWPELLSTALASMVVYFLAKKHAPGGD
ncbi:hypothetical protein [Fundidesulfovibrio agrisoli]|uniref:hypothetical protein n=1 Tax=Fundidesulfovibrio agrisoli TaxID=2922717 RepID=UPI001FAD6A1D|nr:hypothetical protein [Fundidesulfovibrio agrisoli]